MADDKDGVVAQGPAHPYTSIRDAHDAEQHRSLRHDPSNEDAQADIANDESFPASDPPSHASANHLERRHPRDMMRKRRIGSVFGESSTRFQRTRLFISVASKQAAAKN